MFGPAFKGNGQVEIPKTKIGKLGDGPSDRKTWRTDVRKECLGKKKGCGGRPEEKTRVRPGPSVARVSGPAEEAVDYGTRAPWWVESNPRNPRHFGTIDGSLKVGGSMYFE